MVASRAQSSLHSVSPKKHKGAHSQAVPVRYFLTPIAYALLWVAASVAAWVQPQSAHAQAAPAAAEARHDFDIPAGSLDQALIRFGQQSGAALSVDAQVTAGLNSPGLRCSYTRAEALTRLLAGTGTEAVRDASGEYTLRKLPASQSTGGVATLPAIAVTGNEIDPVAQRVNPPTSIGSKVPLTQREIPQSVSVLTQEQLQDQKINTLDDAMRRAPGVFTQKDDSARAEYFSRGFPIDNFQIDGTPVASSLAANTQNLTGYDRVEVLRGPAGLLNSIGGPGGAINMVRKKPTRDPMLTAGASFGSYGDYRQDVDASSALNEDGTLRGRIAGALVNQDTPRKGAHRNDGSVYGVLEYDLTPSTLLRAGVNYDRQSFRDQYDGYPTYSDGSFLKDAKRLYLGADWNRQTYTTTNYFADLEQKLGNEWVGKFSVSHLEYDFNGKMSSPSDAVDPSTNTVLMRQIYGQGNDKQDSADAYVSGPYWLLGRRHQLTVGANYLHERLFQSNQYISLTDLFGYTSTSIYDVNIPEPVFDGPLYQRTTTTATTGIFANTRVSLADPLTLVLGGRMTWWSSEFKPDPDANFLNAPGTDDSITAHFTPYAGLIYDIDPHHSVYGSYTQIFQPQSQRDAEGQLLKPLSGDQYELGIKGEYLNGKVNAGLAVFQITQKNRALLDRSDPLGNTYIPQGKARARGIEATVSGEIQPGWDVMAGYTYTATKYLDDSSNTGSNFSGIAPKHMFKLWTNYHLPDQLNKWSVGGGVYVTSNFYNDYFGPRIAQGGYATVDGKIAYQLTPHTQVALNVFNIFNRGYYERVGDETGGNWLGAPRTFMLTLRASY